MIRQLQRLEYKGELISNRNGKSECKLGDSTNSARRSSINGSMISETKLCVAKPQEVVTTVKRVESLRHGIT